MFTLTVVKACILCGEPVIEANRSRCATCRKKRNHRDERRRRQRPADPYMGAPPDPTPARVLRRELAARRAAGEVFVVAWESAVRSAVMAADRDEARGWTDALWSTRTAWRRAYERTGDALLVVTPDLIGVESDRRGVAVLA